MTWTKLTRRDLRGFDTQARDLVLEAIRRGAVARITSRGHVIIRTPTGHTLTISPSSGRQANRGLRNARADLARLLPDPA